MTKRLEFLRNQFEVSKMWAMRHFTHWQSNNKYLIIGGVPDILNGTIGFTSMMVVGLASNGIEARKMWDDNYDAHAGLLMILDTATFQEIAYDKV